MIHLNDLVKLKHEPPPVYVYGAGQSDRQGWIGIVVGVRHSAVSQAADVLWPQVGDVERWSAAALEVVSYAS